MAASGTFVDLVSFLASRGQSDEPKARPRRVIRSTSVQLDREPVQIGGTTNAVGQPKVRVHTRNNLVERIEVLCACGRSVELALDYDNGRAKTAEQS